MQSITGKKTIAIMATLGIAAVAIVGTAAIAKNKDKEKSDKTEA